MPVKDLTDLRYFQVTIIVIDNKFLSFFSCFLIFYVIFSCNLSRRIYVLTVMAQSRWNLQWYVFSQIILDLIRFRFNHFSLWLLCFFLGGWAWSSSESWSPRWAQRNPQRPPCLPDAQTMAKRRRAWPVLQPYKRLRHPSHHIRDGGTPRERSRGCFSERNVGHHIRRQQQEWCHSSVNSELHIGFSNWRWSKPSRWSSCNVDSPSTRRW